jgi:hypothetical protein
LFQLKILFSFHHEKLQLKTLKSKDIYLRLFVNGKRPMPVLTFIFGLAASYRLSRSLLAPNQATNNSPSKIES